MTSISNLQQPLTPLANAPTNYMVCSTVRSGSTLLCKTLGSIKNCGQPEEYFHRHTIRRLKLNHNPDTFLSYCQTIYQQSLRHSGCFGIKMMWPQLVDFLTLAHQSPQFKTASDREILNHLFPNLTFIYLRRQDSVAQAVSAAIATQTGQWEKSTSTPQTTTRPIKFQPWHIYEWDNALKEHNAAWQTFFTQNNITYHSLTYEKLTQSFTSEISALLRYINSPIQLKSETLTLPTQKQANARNQTLIRDYKQLPKPLLAIIHSLYRQLKPLPKETLGETK